MEQRDNTPRPVSPERLEQLMKMPESVREYQYDWRLHQMWLRKKKSQDEWRAANLEKCRERQREYQKAYYAKNREKIKAAQRERTKKRREEDPEGYRALMKKYQKKRLEALKEARRREPELIKEAQAEVERLREEAKSWKQQYLLAAQARDTLFAEKRRERAATGRCVDERGLPSSKTDWTTLCCGSTKTDPSTPSPTCPGSQATPPPSDGCAEQTERPSST
jgi:hypothetical protein